MTPPAERKAKERKAKRDAGLVRVEMWVPKMLADPLRRYVAAQVELHRIAQEWKAEPIGPITATMIAEMEKNAQRAAIANAESPCSYCGTGPCIATGQAIGIWPPPNCATPPDAQALTRGDE